MTHVTLAIHFNNLWDTLPETKTRIQKIFNGQSDIPLILKDIASTKISDKGLNTKTDTYTGIIFTCISKRSITNIYNSD